MPKKLIAIFLIFFGMVASVHATPAIIVRQNLGGLIKDFRKDAEALAKSHAHMVIDGECTSACTLYFVYLQGNICVTDRAVVGFHQASIPLTDDKGKVTGWERDDIVTAWWHNMLPPKMKAWVDAHHAMDTHAITYLSGAELQKIVKKCPQR